jgi:hypothetical protein
MGNDLSSSGEAGEAGRNNSARPMDLGDDCGPWYATDHFKLRMEERCISPSSIRRAILWGRCEPAGDGAVKRSYDQVTVLLNEQRRSLITVYPVNEPEPEPAAGWGSLITTGLCFVGVALAVAVALAEAQQRREEEEARKRRYF